MGLGIYGFIQRGFEAKIKPVLELPLAETDCISCGQCVETCPTGAIIDKVDATKPGPWILKKEPTICQYCSIGCSMNADVLEGRVLKISADKNATVNEYGNLCIKGRYGFRYINDQNRIKSPMLRKNGKLTSASWEEAFDFTADKIAKQLGRNSEWAVFGSPHATSEENYLLQKFSRTTLNTNNIGTYSNLYEMPEELLRASLSNTTFDKIDKSDFLLVCNFDPINTHPVLYIKLQKAVRRGQTIYMGCCPDSKLAKKSNSLNIPDDKKVLFLKYIVDMISRSDWFEKSAMASRKNKIENLFAGVTGISRNTNLSEFNLTKTEFERFFKKLLSAKNPLFLCHRENANPEIIHWLNSLGYILGQTEAFLSLSSSINFQGLLDMGVNHQYLPGYQKITKPEIIKKMEEAWGSEIPAEEGLSAWEMHHKINNGVIKNAIFWNQDPVGSADLPIKRTTESLIIVADMFLTETAMQADVVFPLVPFFETDGMITNAEARIEQFKKVVKSRTGMENWSLLKELGNRFGNSFCYQSIDDVRNEIFDIVPEYQKEFAIFRNGYTPDEKLLDDVKYRSVKFGANFLLKWMDQLNRATQNNTQIDMKIEKELIK
jgi:predicted molibdopterin-dependent oxidoreductase YjgC